VAFEQAVRLDSRYINGTNELGMLYIAMAADAREPVGLYFGTTAGELWASRDEGERWRCIARHLPQIHAVEVAEPAA